MNEKNPLLTATPEELGIPSLAINNFIQRLEKNNICMHSLIILRHNKIAAEGYWKPFSAEKKHRMYSITKSFVSIAIGFMIEEGLIKFDDKIISFFEDKLPTDGVPEDIAEMTIRDLLQMTTCNKEATYEIIKDNDWLKTFFAVKPDHKPGTVFNYDKSGSYVLGAIVERLSGQYLLDYLRPKFLDKIGFSSDAYCIKSPMGISNGSSGLVCRPRDVAKFTLLCMNKGKYDGKQLIPYEYINEAISKQINTDNERFEDDKEGYGYQFWRCRNNGFACKGKGSQFVICIPDKDFALITTADTRPNPEAQKVIFNSLWEEIYSKLSDTALNENIDERNKLYDKLSNLIIRPVLGNKTAQIAEQVHSHIYRFAENPMGIINARIDFDDDKNVIEYEKNNHKYKLFFGMGKNISGKFPEYDYNCISSGAWINEKTLVINCYITDDDFGTLVITLNFDGKSLTVDMKKFTDTSLDEYEGTAKGEMF